MGDFTNAQHQALRNASETALTPGRDGNSPCDYMPESIGEHSACRALVRRGCFTVVSGAVHIETLREGFAYRLTLLGREMLQMLDQQKRSAESAVRIARVG
jgi:hypothetical protein